MIAVIITFIICSTFIALALIGSSNNVKQEENK